MGVWLVVTSVDCVLIWPGEVALAGEFTSGLGKGRGVGLLAGWRGSENVGELIVLPRGSGYVLGWKRLTGTYRRAA